MGPTVAPGPGPPEPSPNSPLRSTGRSNPGLAVRGASAPPAWSFDSTPALFTTRPSFINTRNGSALRPNWLRTNWITSREGFLIEGFGEVFSAHRLRKPLRARRRVGPDPGDDPDEEHGLDDQHRGQAQDEPNRNPPIEAPVTAGRHRVWNSASRSYARTSGRWAAGPPFTFFSPVRAARCTLHPAPCTMPLPAIATLPACTCTLPACHIVHVFGRNRRQTATRASAASNDADAWQWSIAPVVAGDGGARLRSKPTR